MNIQDMNFWGRTVSGEELSQGKNCQGKNWSGEELFWGRTVWGRTVRGRTFWGRTVLHPIRIAISNGCKANMCFGGLGFGKTFFLNINSIIFFWSSQFQQFLLLFPFAFQVQIVFLHFWYELWSKD